MVIIIVLLHIQGLEHTVPIQRNHTSMSCLSIESLPRHLNPAVTFAMALLGKKHLDIAYFPRDGREGLEVLRTLQHKEVSETIAMVML